MLAVKGNLLCLKNFLYKVCLFGHPIGLSDRLSLYPHAVDILKDKKTFWGINIANALNSLPATSTLVHKERREEGTRRHFCLLENQDTVALWAGSFSLQSQKPLLASSPINSRGSPPPLVSALPAKSPLASDTRAAVSQWRGLPLWSEWPSQLSGRDPASCQGQQPTCAHPNKVHPPSLDTQNITGSPGRKGIHTWKLTVSGCLHISS